MNIYLLPGLGFDHSVYQKLELQGGDLEYIDWMEPLPKEDFKAYAVRMSATIPDDADDIVLIGQSLGGMLCQEIAAIKRVSTIILISTIKSRKEMPLTFKIVRPLGLYRLFGKNITLNTVKYWGKNHDYVSPKEQDLFKSMVGKQTNHCLQWSLKELSSWVAPKLPSSTKVFHIHGEKDNTWPISLIDKPDVVIEGAGHFMLYKEAKKISRIINQELQASGKLTA